MTRLAPRQSLPTVRRLATLLLAALLLAACGAVTQRTSPAVSPALTSSASKGGGYYKDDGPGDNAPANLEAIPDAVPRDEPLHRFANKPYAALGKNYVPLRSRERYQAQGVASWYGRKYHGQKTSSGEVYDMYGMTAAHPVLPIPSYVRVTNPGTGKSVVLRINDRGPFHAGRLIDLSYTAAWKLGYIGSGSTKVEVESVHPGDAAPAPAPAKAPPPVEDDDPIARFAALPDPAPAVRASPASGNGGSGTFIQLGAFGNPDNAETFRARIARELDWAADGVRTQSDSKLHRVQLGPFASRAEAETAAEKVRAALGVKPAIVVR